MEMGKSFGRKGSHKEMSIESKMTVDLMMMHVAGYLRVFRACQKKRRLSSWLMMMMMMMMMINVCCRISQSLQGMSEEEKIEQLELDIKCLQLLRGLIHNEIVKLPDDWELDPSSCKKLVICYAVCL